MSDNQRLDYGFIQCSAPVKEELAVKGIELLRNLPLQVRVQRFTDSFDGGLRPDCRAAKDVLKTATGVSNMLCHKTASFLASLVQWPSNIGQRVIVPTRFCVSYQVDFFH